MKLINNIFNIKNININSKTKYSYLFFIAILFFWIFLLPPLLLKIPNNFKYTADVVSVDNFYDEITNEYKGEQYSKTVFSYEVIDKKGKILFIKNIFDVKGLDGKQIFKTEPVYTINSFTGKHLPYQDKKERNGYLFAPSDLKKGQSFEYWHVSSNASSKMEYVGEEYLYGLKVYKYEKSNTEAIDQTEFMGFLPGVPEKRGVKLSSKLEMWVEPVSGYPVKIEDASLDYFYFDIKTGEKLYPYNKFANTYSEQSIKEHADFARITKNKFLVVKFGPMILFGLFIVFILFSRLPTYKKFIDFIRNNKLAIVIFLISVGISGFVFGFIKNNISIRNNEDFKDQSIAMETKILERVSVYENSLFGARGLFDVSEKVDRDEWKLYVQSLNLQSRYPGIQGVGYSQFIKPNEKDAVIKQIRSEGYPNFNIRPDGKRSIYTSIIYLEPLDKRNLRAFGFDMFSEEVRRRAMVRARDNAELAASGKVLLLQENENDTQSGFLFYLPVYKNGIIPKTIEQRKENILGYVYAPIRMGDFMAGVFGSSKYDLDLHIYNGLRIDPEKKMFDLEDGNQFDDRDSKDVLFRKISTVYIGGEPFTLEFINLKSYQISTLDKVLPYAFLVFGLIFSFLIFLVIYSNTEGRKRALEDLEKSNAKLKDNIKELDNTKKAILNVLEDVEVQKKNYENVSKRLTLATISAKIGVWEWDIVKNNLIWDDQMYELYGIKKEDFGGAYDAWQAGLHPEDRKLGDKAIQSALKGESVFSPQFRVIWPNGEIRYIQAYALVDRDSQGKPIRMVGVNWDITKEKEIDKQKTEFVSLASHQLKTPIGAIQWDLEMLLAGDYGRVTGKQKEVLNEAYTMGRRMNDLVNALLNISRIEMGVFVIEPHPTDFVKLCEEVIKEMKPRLIKKGHELIKNFDEHLVEIPADDKLLRIIYQNLISNAIKYTPDKGKITISLKLEDENVVLSVANNGDPIPKKEQSKIFTKMFRASNAQEQDPDGNGLGLYMVKQIVENAGGKIWFTSKKGEDTIFYCSFPKTGMIAKSGTKKLT